MTDGMKEVTLKLPEHKAQLLLLVLREADDALANRGCSEFDFEKLVPNLAARQAFMKQFNRANGTPEEYEEDMQDEHRSQFTVFSISFAASHFVGCLYDEMAAAGIEDRTEEVR